MSEPNAAQQRRIERQLRMWEQCPDHRLREAARWLRRVQTEEQRQQQRRGGTRA